MNRTDNEKVMLKVYVQHIMNIVSYPGLKGSHRMSQYSSVWKQKKMENDGGNIRS